MRLSISATLTGLLAAGIVLTAAPAAATVKDGVDQWKAGSYDRAVAAWRGPAAAGDADAQFNLAQAYKLGRGVTTDLRTAEGWYRKAAEQGHQQAQATLGLVMFQNGDRKGALPWLKTSADRGEPRAQYVYGTALFNGDLVAKDWPRAYALMTRAAAAGLPQAAQSLRQMDEFIPVGDRQRGVEIARTLPNQAMPTTLTDAGAAGRTAAAVARASTPPSATPAAPAPARGGPRLAMSTPPALPPNPSPAPKPAPAPIARPAAAAPSPARPAPVIRAAASGRWRIQLGAFGSADAARSAWSGLKSRAPALAGLTPTFQPAGAVTRLQAGGFASRTDAQRACAAAKSGCFPVAP